MIVASPFAALTAELWLARRLPCPALFDGITTTEERRERVRRELLDRGIADQVVGRRSGQPETWSSLFRRLYRQELIQELDF